MKKIVRPLLLTLLSALVILPAAAQELTVISSPYLHADDSVLVFIPAQYADNYSDRYCAECCGDPEAVPALFLLHGWSGCYSNWADKSDLQRVAISRPSRRRGRGSKAPSRPSAAGVRRPRD